jgi:hypothetical protein
MSPVEGRGLPPLGCLAFCYGPAMTEVETTRLLLRPWQSDDLAEFTRLLTDPEVTRYIVVHTQFSPQDLAELSQRTLEQWERNGFGPWAAIEKQTGRWVGRIGLDELPDWPGPHKIEVGWELHREFWGRGLATEGGLARGALWLRDGGAGADHQRHHGHQRGVAVCDGEVRAALPGRAGDGRDGGGLACDRPDRLGRWSGQHVEATGEPRAPDPSGKRTC